MSSTDIPLCSNRLAAWSVISIFCKELIHNSFAFQNSSIKIFYFGRSLPYNGLYRTFVSCIVCVRKKSLVFRIFSGTTAHIQLLMSVHEKSIAEKAHYGNRRFCGLASSLKRTLNGRSPASGQGVTSSEANGILHSWIMFLRSAQHVRRPGLNCYRSLPGYTTGFLTERSVCW